MENLKFVCLSGGTSDIGKLSVEYLQSTACCGKMLRKVENSKDMEERNVDVRQNLTLPLANVESSMMIFLRNRLM